MGGVKKYFKKEFSTNMFLMGHDSTRDFYLACWQKSQSVLPLLFIRTIIFVGCASTVVTSMVLTVPDLGIGSWFIFLTHWGIILNLLASIFALIVSISAYFKEPIDKSSGLPWYIKIYWILYNIATPIAFFITVFYWVFLTNMVEDDSYAINLVVDILVHGVNSILMLAMVLFSRHPTNLLHFYLPVSLGIIYMFFTIVFHFSEALSPFGTSWIYPMLDWNYPGITIGVIIGSAVGIIIMHTLVVLISVARDKLTRRFRETNSISISNQNPISYNYM